MPHDNFNTYTSIQAMDLCCEKKMKLAVVDLFDVIILDGRQQKMQVHVHYLKPLAFSKDRKALACSLAIAMYTKDVHAH